MSNINSRNSQIRNFAIISHIDHGKSTLADRFLELTGTVDKNKMQPQYLDRMDLEREKGITIKMHPVQMIWQVPSRLKKFLRFPFFILNLIDTPGHVDFSYEVSRSLACCEGAILLVDATQGIQAQTLANLYLALEQNLEIIPVVNKIDLKEAETEKCTTELARLIGCSRQDVIKISAKLGTGVDLLLQAMARRIPAPKISKEKSLKALVFDSLYDEYQGVIAYVRVFEGCVAAGDKAKLFSQDESFQVEEVGVFKPERVKTKKLESGEIGYIVTGIKEIYKCRVGETIASLDVKSALPGYKKIKPNVFASVYPQNADRYSLLKQALGKLKLSDAALYFEPEKSIALGPGFKCGFLGSLHLEITCERLKRHFGLDIIVTSPSVVYEVVLKNKKKIKIYRPLDWPRPEEIYQVFEPWTEVEIIMPVMYFGQIMQLVKNFRGSLRQTEFLDEKKVLLRCQIPLSDLISGFYNRLKSISSGFASYAYKIIDLRPASLVKLDILVAGERVEALSKIVPEARAYQEGRRLVRILKETLPPQNFAVSLQAAIGNKIIAREDIRALRKDVLAKLYGGDYTRKMKLLEKQKRGKKKLKVLGRLKIPNNVFLEILKKS